jgi:hypothetical protein
MLLDLRGRLLQQPQAGRGFLLRGVAGDRPDSPGRRRQCTTRRGTATSRESSTVAYKRRLDLAIVLYTHQLSASIRPVMQYVDVVSLWIWSGSDIQVFESSWENKNAEPQRTRREVLS